MAKLVPDGEACGQDGVCRVGICCHRHCTGAICGEDGCGGQCQCVLGQCHEATGICDVDGWALIRAGIYNLGTEAYSFTGAEEGWEEGLSAVDSPTTVLTHDTSVHHTEVTRNAFVQLMGYAPWPDDGCGDQCPAENVTWFEAVQFANEMSEVHGFQACYKMLDDDSDGDGFPDVIWEAGYDCNGYRLPAFAEWWWWARASRLDVTYSPGGFEKMCMQGWGYGGELLSDIGWFSPESADVPHPVAQKLPSQWGLFDAFGNVPEWTYDTYEFVNLNWCLTYDQDTTAIMTNPGTDADQGQVCEPATKWGCKRRVVVGWGYLNAADFLGPFCALDIVDEALPDSGQLKNLPYQPIGFRLVRTVDLRRAEEVAP